MKKIGIAIPVLSIFLLGCAIMSKVYINVDDGEFATAYINIDGENAGRLEKLDDRRGSRIKVFIIKPGAHDIKLTSEGGNVITIHVDVPPGENYVSYWSEKNELNWNGQGHSVFPGSILEVHNSLE